jgi:plastocyanin
MTVLAAVTAGGLAAAAGITVQLPTAAAAGNPGRVTIENFSFGPTTLTVAAGTTVIWTNNDDDPHTVVSATDPKLMKSPPLDTGETFSYTFDRPGTYKYFCTVHPRMQGSVVVR